MPNLCNTIRLQSSNLGQLGLCKALIVLSSFHKCIAALKFCGAYRMKRLVINVHRSLGRRLAALLVCELSGTDIFPVHSLLVSRRHASRLLLTLSRRLLRLKPAKYFQ